MRSGRREDRITLPLWMGLVTATLLKGCGLWGQERGKADRDIPLTMKLVPRTGNIEVQQGRVSRLIH